MKRNDPIGRYCSYDNFCRYELKCRYCDKTLAYITLTNNEVNTLIKAEIADPILCPKCETSWEERKVRYESKDN